MKIFTVASFSQKRGYQIEFKRLNPGGFAWLRFSEIGLGFSVRGLLPNGT
jgi:hypothetical protein